jgi:hypothetical protein
MNSRFSFAFYSSMGCCLLLLGLLPALGSAQSPRPPATVQRVTILGSPEAPEVQITASEPITPEARALKGPDRVVVDFPGALPANELKSFAVNRGAIRRVRIGLFQTTPPITRVVFDLTTPTDYQLLPSGNTVIARFEGVARSQKPLNVPQISQRTPLPSPVFPSAQPLPENFRDYAASRAQVKQALGQLEAYSANRLPVLEGFARPEADHLERYEHPYYQYRIEVAAIDAAHTRVKVVAKLSAWFNDPTGSDSGYRSLPSSGRLEGDLLDRLQEALESKDPIRTSRSATKDSLAEQPDPLPRADVSPSGVAGEETSHISQSVVLLGAKTEVASASEDWNTQDQESGYWVSRQEIHPFTGEWSVLKGKSVLFLFAQRRGVRSSRAPDEQRIVFLKRVFAETYRTASHSPTPIQGVVVVFAGGRGAVAAASLTDIRQWIQGSLSDDAFIERCSLDPMAEFPRPLHAE